MKNRNKAGRKNLKKSKNYLEKNMEIVKEVGKKKENEEKMYE